MDPREIPTYITSFFFAKENTQADTQGSSSNTTRHPIKIKFQKGGGGETELNKCLEMDFKEKVSTCSGKPVLHSSRTTHSGPDRLKQGRGGGRQQKNKTPLVNAVSSLGGFKCTVFSQHRSAQRRRP